MGSSDDPPFPIPNRIGFTIGRDIRLPGAAAGPLNYVIYPHVEIDGQVYSNVRAEFEFSDTSGLAVFPPAGRRQ